MELSIVLTILELAKRAFEDEATEVFHPKELNALVVEKARLEDKLGEITVARWVAAQKSTIAQSLMLGDDSEYSPLRAGGTLQ